MQVSKLCKVLNSMADRGGRQGLRVEGDLEIARVLTAEKIRGVSRQGRVEGAAQVFHSDTATIQSGGALVRTVRGSHSHGRTKTDHYVYVPFMKRTSQNPCIMRIDQLLLVKRADMGWPDDEARLAVGMLYDKISIGTGGGNEVHFNEDPGQGATVVPRILYAKEAQLAQGYPWAVHLRQVHCPVVYLPGPSWSAWVTISKMGYHGRTDMHDS